jgi:hypothetical protein
MKSWLKRLAHNIKIFIDILWIANIDVFEDMEEHQKMLIGKVVPNKFLFYLTYPITHIILTYYIFKEFYKKENK